uniref:Vexin n=1 Tax=Gopherus agassizii TaxID=38772 RepID=A0A452HPR4_9SAUR
KGSEKGNKEDQGHRQHSRKNTEHDLTLAPEADASLPLTGNNLCGTPGILRKMWMKHKKKSEYLGATNSAFEAD